MFVENHKLTPRERRAYNLGCQMYEIAKATLSHLEDLAEAHGLVNDEAIQAVAFHLNQLIRFSRVLKDEPAPMTYTTQYIIHEMQRHSRELETVLSIHIRNLYPGFGGDVPNPLEQLKEASERSNDKTTSDL